MAAAQDETLAHALVSLSHFAIESLKVDDSALRAYVLASLEGDSTVCLARNPARGFALHNELDTMPRRKRTRFGSGTELREAAQNDFGRSLSAESFTVDRPAGGSRLQRVVARRRGEPQSWTP